MLISEGFAVFLWKLRKITQAHAAVQHIFRP